MAEQITGSRFSTGLAGSAFLVAVCLAQAQLQAPASPATAQESVKTFLRSYLRGLIGRDEKTTRYSAAFVDLSGGGKQEVIVYLRGPWCGSGGCTTLVLARMGDSYRLITKISITRLPIRVLENKSHGWRSIGIWVEGRIMPYYEVELQFDGTTYPSNPSAPFIRLPRAAKARGEVVLSGSEAGTPLYP
ncbi:conserved exported hypothetical protein [Candidatus Sulfopaludibacter sp. SbA3]|nr:conserved exported hypothetical protein [Candidatus Sulfopaludibacter sp. SbA3]